MRPKRSDSKYWTGTKNFDHIRYESDLEDYISDLEDQNEQLHKLSIGGPASESVSEGERLGNEAGEKGVSGGPECPHFISLLGHPFYCDECDEQIT